MASIQITLLALCTPTARIQEMPFIYKSITTAAKAGLYALERGLAQDMYVRVRIPLAPHESLFKTYKEHIIDVRDCNYAKT